MLRIISSVAMATSLLCSAHAKDKSNDKAAAATTTEQSRPNLAHLARAYVAKDRSSADRSLDKSRKPIHTLKFMGLKPGDKAIEFLAGGGYYAKIMGDAVGPEGSVVAVNPPSFLENERGLKLWSGLTAQDSNITLSLKNFSDFKPKSAEFDFAMMHLVYHDVYFESEKLGITYANPDVFLANLYTAMKPGGTVAVIDHYGPKGDTRDIAAKLHRIHPDIVKSDFAKAGFILAGETDILANDEDDQTMLVFNPKVRGKTSRFMFKFTKPKARPTQ